MKRILITLFTISLLIIAGCKKKTQEEDVIIIGASPTPHADILKFAEPLIKEKGIKIKIVEMSDYITPNTALDSGDISANYMQHEPYLKDFNAKNRLKNKLVSVGRVHFEPLGLYAGKSSDIENIKEGAVIGIPSDPTNGARALWLLDRLGIIQVRDGAGFEATEIDIIKNPKNITVKPLEAAQIPASLPDLDFGVINGNYALGAGISDKLITSESRDSESARTFGNIITVRESDANKPEIRTIISLLQGPEVQQFITDTYKNVIVPVQ